MAFHQLQIVVALVGMSARNNENPKKESANFMELVM